ncbi:MAG: hypothetical protein QOG62_2736, partial [Thermoleophilaceae bacterium]|jgi:hypothetical protein|nr:hypothetical protein [Thermoleophilaceae bacterium]
VAVLFGSTLFGVLGAIIAIPAAASIQIAAREFLEYRNGEIVIDEVGEDPAPEPAADPDADADEPEGAASPDGA